MLFTVSQRNRQDRAGPNRVLLVVLALFPLPRAASLAQESQSIPAFPAHAEAITVDVVVLDNEGRPVRGLGKEDFTLLEDGRPQTIVGFQVRELTTPAKEFRQEVGVNDERVAANQGSSERRGRTFAFLLDDIGTRPLPMEDVKKSIARWLREKADARDEVTLATVSGDVWWSDRIDRGRADLETVLSRARGKKLPEHRKDWISDWEAYRIVVYEDATGAAAASAGPAAGGAGGPTLFAQVPAGRILDRVVGRIELSPAQVRMMAMERYNDLNRRVRTVLGATERLSRGLAGGRGRKSILLFSEGFLYDPNERSVFDRAIDASQRANTVVYFIDAKGLVGDYSFGADQKSQVNAAPSVEENVYETTGTEQVAENTGGMSVRNTNDLFGGLAKVGEESSTYYLLGYQPEKAPDGKWHRLEVKVTRPGVTVRSRRGYQATAPSDVAASRQDRDKHDSDGKKSSSKGPIRPLDPAVMASPADDTIALRVAPYVVGVEKVALARVLIALEVDMSTLAFDATGTRRQATVDLTILGLSRDEPKLFPLDERLKLDLQGAAVGGWLTLSREIRLPAGVAQVRVLVRDVATGRAGTVTQRLVVPALDRPYLSTPILTDRIETPRGGPPRLVPLAHRRFRPEGRLYCAYEVFGMTDTEGRATTQVAGSHTLQTEEGRVISTSPLTGIAVDLGGRVVRMLALPLDGLDEGGYQLTLEVVDQMSGRTLVTHEAFVLEREARVSRGGM
jgi:VWFA-related protein